MICRIKLGTEGWGIGRKGLSTTRPPPRVRFSPSSGRPLAGKSGLPTVWPAASDDCLESAFNGVGLRWCRALSGRVRTKAEPHTSRPIAAHRQGPSPGRRNMRLAGRGQNNTRDQIKALLSTSRPSFGPPRAVPDWHQTSQLFLILEWPSLEKDPAEWPMGELFHTFLINLIAAQPV